MSEQAAKLRATIAELELELRDVEKLDPETRAMLETALEEIRDALRTPAPADAGQPHSLASGLRTAARDFEGSHPTLAQMVHRVVDALAQWGI